MAALLPGRRSEHREPIDGARVVTATSASGALTAFSAHKPDVVVSDIGMPEIDGYELARRLSSVPKVALTAFARTDDKERAIAAGFDTHVAKPVEPAELILAVLALCSRQKG